MKFWFRYLSGVIKPKSPALHLGSAVHETLKFWNRARWHGQAPTLAELHQAFKIAWEQEQGESDANSESMSDQTLGWKLCETYFRESPIPPNEKPEAVEATVEMDLSTHGLPKLLGVLDLVRAGGRIVDFKTTGRSPVPEQIAHTTETQTTLYALLYREATGKKESAIEIHSLVKTRSPKLVVTTLPVIGDGQISRLFRQIESHVNGLQREDFVPSPGMGCLACEFFEECRTWTGQRKEGQ